MVDDPTKLRGAEAKHVTSADLSAAAPRPGLAPGPGLAAPVGGRSPGSAGMRLAQLACGIGLLFAAVSIYWALGGMWLVDTLHRSFQEGARTREPGLVLVVWAAAVLKVVAAVLPLVALHRLTRPGWNRLVWVLSWLAAAILTFYGLVNTAAGLLVLWGVIGLSAAADHRTLTWYAYLWDPWFLAWGLLAAAALLRGRHGLRQAADDA